MSSCTFFTTSLHTSCNASVSSSNWSRGIPYLSTSVGGLTFLFWQSQVTPHRQPCQRKELTYPHKPTNPAKHREGDRVVRAPKPPTHLPVVHERPLSVVHPPGNHPLPPNFRVVNKLLVAHIPRILLGRGGRCSCSRECRADGVECGLEDLGLETGRGLRGLLVDFVIA